MAAGPCLASGQPIHWAGQRPDSQGLISSVAPNGAWFIVVRMFTFFL